MYRDAATVWYGTRQHAVYRQLQRPEGVSREVGASTIVLQKR